MTEERKIFGKRDGLTIPAAKKPSSNIKISVARKTGMPVGFMLLQDAIRKLDAVVFKELDEN